MKATLKNYWDILKEGVRRMNTKYGKMIYKSSGIKKGVVLSLIFMLLSFLSTAQTVSSSIDTAQIRIGEQITYKLTVETASSDDLVIFPEGQSFVPLEMIESYSVDTLKNKDRFKVLKEYALTQFDSGSYTIPRQQVQINDRSFFTDSISVVVADVVVDTTKQKLYPIKPSVSVPSQFEFPTWGWWLIALVLLGLLIYFFFRRKKKKEEAAKKLPPYEQALFELKQLDSSHLLEQRKIKEYYSQLSAAVRRYLDGEVYDHAMESTTGELIVYLEKERNAGKLYIKDETIEGLKQILYRADLAKFANSKPDVITAKEDRSKMETIINDTKEGIPEPTEEELLQDQLYRERKDKKRKQRKLIIAGLAVLMAAGAFTAYLVTTKGFTYVKDTYLGHPTKELLEGEWITSDYGTPPINITTPRVLKRGEIDLAEEAKESQRGSETFLYGSLSGNYYAAVTSVQVNKQTQFDLEAAVDGIYNSLEKEGAKNIIRKQEKFTSVDGAEGIKIFGRLEMKNPVTGKTGKKEYVILNFSENNAFQQIVLVYNEGDRYADEITERILNSVQLKNAGN